MQLFLVASLPLLFAFVVFLPWDKRQVPTRLSLVATFFKGVLLFFPGYLVIALVRRIAGFSYDGFLLYISLFVRDHAAPLLAATAGFLLLQRFLTINGTDEGTFLVVFAFLCGFLSVVNLTDLVRSWGDWTTDDIFILPCLRVAGVLLVALVANRFYRWEGRDGALFAASVAGVGLLLTTASWLYRASFVVWGSLLAFAGIAAAVIVFALRFPRAVRG
jgi:hypothetical protein